MKEQFFKNEEKVNDPPFQAKFKRSRHNNSFVFLTNHGYYELAKRTIRANGNIYHIFKANIFRDVQILYQDKASMDMTLNEINLLTSTCWIEKYQPLAIDMTKDKNTGRYRLGLYSLFVANTEPF